MQYCFLIDLADVDVQTENIHEWNFLYKFSNLCFPDGNDQTEIDNYGCDSQQHVCYH